MDQFVNRIEELDRLQTLYESGTAELAIIYGRRQIGKSELVRQSIADRDDAVYYQAVQGTATTQLRRFVEGSSVDLSRHHGRQRGVGTALNVPHR